ncbi:MAG: Lrp/AsnC family transcriptional regulator [Nitrososphaerales archaeon]
MDELDLRILEALRVDARRPYLELAKELGVSDATIHLRVKKMVEEGVIKGFTILIDHEKLGYGMTAFIEVQVKPRTADETVSKLSSIDGVLEAHEIHGHCDILLKVKAKGLAELRDKIVNQIKKVEDIVSSKAYTVLKVAKEEHNLPIPTAMK